MSKKRPSTQGTAKSGNPTPAQAGRAAKIAAIKREEEAKKRVTIAIVAVVSVVVLGVVTALVVNALRTPTDDPSTPISTAAATEAPTDAPTQPAATPTGPAASTYSFTYGSGKVQVDVYFDFMCPGCGGFERINGEDLKELADNDTITLQFHPMSFLDRFSQGTQYSTRAANAFVAVADQAPDKAQNFAALLWENQPEENSVGLSDEQIASFAAEAGVPDAVITTFVSLEYATWIEQSTQAALAAGVEVTPGFVVNGEWISGKKGQATAWAVSTPGTVKAELERLANG